MNHKLADFLDSITQEELQQWEEIELVPMKDSLSQKRIQKMVNKKIKRHQKKKNPLESQTAATAIC